MARFDIFVNPNKAARHPLYVDVQSDFVRLSTRWCIPLSRHVQPRPIMHGAQALITLDQQEYVMDTPNLEPGLGRTRDELLAGLRSLPFKRYMIFYVALEDGIDVVRVLHSERDVDAQFHPRA